MMEVFVLIKNGRFYGVYRRYEGALEAKRNQYFDSDFPDEYEIICCRI